MEEAESQLNQLREPAEEEALFPRPQMQVISEQDNSGGEDGTELVYG